MGGKTISFSDTKLDALSFQSSCYGGVIPLVFGVAQVAGNLLWYNGFKPIPHTTTQGGKGGGGVKQQSTTYTYAADVIMSLGHGPISSIPRIWRGKSLYIGGITPSQIVNTVEAYSGGGVNSTYTLTHSADFLTFGQITSVITAPDGSLSTATLSRGGDYTYSQGVVKMMVSKWTGKTLNVAYQYHSSTPLLTALDDLHLTLKSGELGQSPWTGLATYGVQSLGYSGLAIVCGSAYDLGTSASVENHKFEVVAPWAYHLGPSIPDVDMSIVLREVLCNSLAGANMPGQYLDGWQNFSDYVVASNLLGSPVMDVQVQAADMLKSVAELTNTGPVWSGGRLKMIPYGDTDVTGNGRTYTANTTAIYDLDDEAFIPDNGQDPIHFVLTDTADRYNHVRLEYLDRGQQYAPAVAECKDITDIQARGLRSRDIIQAHWVCDGRIARHMAQLVMQRSLYVLATYTFNLPWHYALLEPMDIVTLTDAKLGLSEWPVRITKVQEAADGTLAFEAEDYPAGVCSAHLYGHQASSGYQHDYNVSPGSAAAPFVFEAPAAHTGTGLALRVAIDSSGGQPEWGGAQVWISLDGTEYKMLGVGFGGSRTGTLSASVAGNGDGTIHVHNIQAGQLLSGSAQDAQALSTLCYIGGANPEYLAYQTATLTSAGAYDLTGLVRQAYGTPGGAHASGVPFVRVDEGVVSYEDLDISYIGKTIYVKLCSFNVYGGAQQGLSDVSATPYVVTGNMAQYLPGIAGKGVSVNASSLSFHYATTTSAPTPSAITLTAFHKGILQGTTAWSVVDGSATLSTSGDVCTVDPAVMGQFATIRASVTDALTTYYDDTTIMKINDGTTGAGAPLLTLSLSAQAFTYDGNGNRYPPSQVITATVTLQNITGSPEIDLVIYDANDNVLHEYLGYHGMTAPIDIASYEMAGAAYGVVTATLGSLSDVETIVTLRAGENNIVGDLSNQSVTLAAASNGHVTDFSPAVTVLTIYRGLSNDSSNWSYSVTGNSSWVSGVLTGNSFALNGIEDGHDTGYVDITASRSGFTSVTKRFLISKSKAGVSGSSAPLLSLNCSSQVFTYDGNNNRFPTSQILTITVTLQNVTGTPGIVTSLYDAGNTLLHQYPPFYGAVAPFNITDFDNFGDVSYAVIVASLGSLSDTETIVKLRDGVNNIVGDLTNQAQTLPASNAGVVSSYSGAVTTLVIYRGLVDDSSNWSFSASGSTGMSGPAMSGNTFTLTGMDASVDTGYVDITASRSGYTSITKRFSVSKSKAGAGGAVTPVSPTLGSYSAAGYATSSASTAFAAVKFSNTGFIAFRKGPSATSQLVESGVQWSRDIPPGSFLIKATLNTHTGGGAFGGATTGAPLDSTNFWTFSGSATNATGSAGFSYFIYDSSGTTLYYAGSIVLSCDSSN